MKWFIGFLVLTALSLGGVMAATPKVTLPEVDRQMLTDVALDLRAAILNGNVRKILDHISRSGLTCTDAQYSFKQVRKDLRNRKSHLFLSLFDSKAFSTQCGIGYTSEFPAISEKEFFTADKNPEIEIVAHSLDTARVIFKSHVKGHYQREWWFSKAGNKWKLGEGVIVGDCTCG